MSANEIIYLVVMFVLALGMGCLMISGGGE